jgi:homoserine dehydrogenase
MYSAGHMNSLNPVKVGLLGLGTVGGGTVNVLARNASEITRRAGRGIEITRAAARDLKKPRICNTAGIKLTAKPDDVVNDPEIEIVAELMGGMEPARELVLRAIANGKHVVTANKALIARHGNEIFRAAREQGVMVAFEAAVGGGIPIIKAIREGLAGNRIEWLAGIVNGTSNFILTEMRDDVQGGTSVAGGGMPGATKGREFAEVLAEAQRLGYAEADPAFDVEGIDAAHKLTILAAIAFGIPLQFDKVYTEGITRVTRADVSYAGQFGYRIKHLAIARRTPAGVQLRVHPTLIPQRRLIANVDGVMNAVVVTGDAVGPTLYYGAGAGAEPTASAVVADLVDVVRALTSDPENRVPHLAFQPDALSDLPILPMEQVETAYYLRLQAADRPGVLADVTRILADQEISIEAILQKEPAEEGSDVPVIILTQRVLERRINQAIARIEALTVISAPVARIRLEQLAR